MNRAAEVMLKLQKAKSNFAKKQLKKTSPEGNFGGFFWHRKGKLNRIFLMILELNF